MQIVLEVAEGKTLVGTHPSSNDVAKAVRVITGKHKKWAVMVNDELSSLVKTWDEAARVMRDDGFRVKIEKA